MLWLVGLDSTTAALALSAAGLAVIAVLLLVGRPKIGFALWLCILCFVPEWVQAPLPIGLQPSVVLGALILVTLIGKGRPRWAWSDLLIAAFFLFVVVGVSVGTVYTAPLFYWLTTWGAGYVLGRVFGFALKPGDVAQIILPVFVVVALLALAEAAAGWNPWAQLAFPNADYRTWAPLQFRAGRLRAEGAFGHSIALGASLGLATPFVLISRYRVAVRVGSALILVLAAFATLSRTGMLTVLLSLALSILFLARQVGRRTRAALLLSVVVLGSFLVPRLSDTLEEASTEASGSADYRVQLLRLVPSMQMLGRASGFSVDRSGRPTYSGFQSIDNAVIGLGLTAGILPAVLLLLALALAVAALVTGRANVATVAVVGQIPALVTVSLITQYSVFFWVVAGLAATWAPANRVTEARGIVPETQQASDGGG